MRRYTGIVTITAEDLWEWIRSNYLPKNDDEVCFDTPRYDKETWQFTVDYAGSDEDDPRTWAKRPYWMEG